MTHTYAIMHVTPMAFAEIKRRLEKVDYTHAIHEQTDGTVLLDMHGIALEPLTESNPVGVEIGTLLSHRTKQGVVEMAVNGERIQMDLDKAREIHAMLGSAIEAAVSDTLIYAFLTQKIGLDEHRASAALLDFRELRQGSKDVVRPQ